MADYYPVLARAIASLEHNTPEDRRAVYERARTAIVKQLRGYEPQLSESEITRERLALEDAIRRMEAEQRAATAAAAAPTAPVAPSVGGLQAVREAAAEADALGPAAAAAQSRAAADRAALDGQPVPPAPERIEPRVQTGPAPRATANTAGAGDAVTPPQVPSKARRGSEPGKRTPAVVGIVAVLLLAAAGAGAYFLTDRGSDGAGETVVADADTPEKITDRISPEGEEVVEEAPAAGTADEEPATAEPAVTPDTGQPPATAEAEPGPVAGEAQPAPAATAPVAQQATLYEISPNQEDGVALNGTVAWRVETVNGIDGQGPEQVLRGDVEIPERRTKMTITFQRNTDTTLPAAHIIDVTFSIPPDSPNGGIAEVPGILLKPNEETKGTALLGQIVKIDNVYYSAGLFNDPQRAEFNVNLMRQAMWVDVPVLYDNGRLAVLSFTLGTPGRQAFNQVMEGWAEAARRDAAQQPAPAQ